MRPSWQPPRRRATAPRDWKRRCPASRFSATTATDRTPLGTRTQPTATRLRASPVTERTIKGQSCGRPWPTGRWRGTRSPRARSSAPTVATTGPAGDRRLATLAGGWGDWGFGATLFTYGKQMPAARCLAVGIRSLDRTPQGFPEWDIRSAAQGHFPLTPFNPVS